MRQPHAPVLNVAGATKAYGAGRRRCVAIHPCRFECHSGEIVGVIGPNGAGKTTLLRMIAGETSITSGEVLVAGKRAGTRCARADVGYVADPPLLPGELSGAEWLKYVCGHHASHPRERTAKLQWAMELADLGEFAGRRISHYSRGVTQRLALASAAIAGAKVLVLDEVLSGFDVLVERRLRDRVGRLAATGRLLIIASNDLASIERLATRVLVLWEGRVVSDVSVAKLASERVAELSLSGSGLANRERLLERFADAVNTADGIAIPLKRGITIEEAIAVCRSERIPVAASKVRYRVLDDILLKAATDPNNCV